MNSSAIVIAALSCLSRANISEIFWFNRVQIAIFGCLEVSLRGSVLIYRRAQR